MKRILPLTLTDEDWKIVLRPGPRERYQLRAQLAHVGKICDRRDARIMLTMEKALRLARPFRPIGYPDRCMAHVLMRAEFRAYGSYDWIPHAL